MLFIGKRPHSGIWRWNKLIINLLYGFMCDNMVKEIKMSAEEAIEYVRENVQIRDILEISYNRIFAPGEVLNIISEDENVTSGIIIISSFLYLFC